MNQDTTDRWEGAFVGALTGRSPDAETVAVAETVATPDPSDDRAALRAAREAADARVNALEEELSAWRQGLAPEEEGARLERQWLEFFERCPDIRDPQGELPEAVWQAMAGGLSPVSAYLEHQNTALAAENVRLTAALASVERRQAAALKSPGSAASPSGGSGGVDPFLEGLLGQARRR